jgi:PAS domain S-box-containing protein
MPAAESSQVSACLELARAISHSTNLDGVFEAALDAIARGLRVTRAAFLLFDPDRVMRFKAWRGLSQTYRDAVEGHTPWTPEQVDAEPIVVADVSRSPDLAPLLPALRAEGIESLAFVPLVSAGGVIGKFMLYVPAAHALSPTDLQLATLFAAQTAFAIDNLRAQRAIAESHAAQLHAAEHSGRLASRLAAIVESSHDAIVSKDLNGVITSWNRGAERIFGYSAQEAIGRSVTLIIPTDRLQEEDTVLNRIRAGQGVELETVRRRKDGSLRDISLTISPVRDGSGRIVGASKIARDITERKRREAELADLHTRLRSLVDASALLLGAPDAKSVRVAALDIGRRLIEADAYAIWQRDGDAWRMVHAEGVSEGFSRRSVDPSHPDADRLLQAPLVVTDVASLPLLEPQLEAYQREGVASLLVCPMGPARSRNATIVFYWHTRRTFRDVEIETAQTLANLASVALTTADLYERQRALRRSAETAGRRMAFLADATAVLSRSLDYEDTLAAVARLAVPTIADWCAVDIIGDDGRLERLAMAHEDPSKLELVRELERRYPADPTAPGGSAGVVRTGKPVLLEVIGAAELAAAARDEEHRRILDALQLRSYICVPLVTPNGTFGALTFVQAQSGRQYAADDLQFAQSVAARASLAIDNARAYRRANEANRLKDEFLATLSHELRTPLNAVLGYAQMLEMGMLSPERRTHAISVLLRNGETLSQIINDVLDISRITAGKLRLRVEPTDLAGILADAVATVQPAADARGVILNTLVDETVPPVSGDPDRLQQVCWNLLSNAVKFTPRGGHVQVRLERADAADPATDPTVQISVSDTGRGIDPEFLPHIFERFRQADSRVSREQGGLGLGLAIVRELIQLHGGTVSAASKGPGTGTTFRVVLPAMALQPKHLPRAGSAADEARALPSSRRLDGVRVLAVDDEEDSLDLLRTVLEDAGARVTTARSAASALDELRAGIHDVLLADIGMPRMDGLELIRTVRDALPEPTNRLPAAALTAYARAEDRISALASGFQMHIPKPVNAVELVIAVSALARRRPAG